MPSARREAHLLDVLAGLRSTGLIIATAVHGPDPAARIWALPNNPIPRRRLHELPSDHGPAASTNPNPFTDLSSDV